jgi:hypothetical protein
MIKASTTIEQILEKTQEYQLCVQGRTYIMDLKKLDYEVRKVSNEFLQSFE